MADVGSPCNSEKEKRDITRQQNKEKNDCEHCLQDILRNGYEAGIIEMVHDTAAIDLTQVVSLELEDVKVDLSGTESLHLTTTHACGQLKSVTMQEPPSSCTEKTVLLKEEHRMATRQRLNRIVKEGEVSWPGQNKPLFEVMVRARRCGIVETTDGVSVLRRQARVLRKKFGEGLMPDTCAVFNKKL